MVRRVMYKWTQWLVAVMLILAPGGLQAAFEYESLLNTAVRGPVLDVATDPEEDLVFVLTPGEILIYSTGDPVVLDRIPLDKGFTRIAYQAESRLVLTAQYPPRIHVIRFDRVYDIELKDRAIKGPPNAKATLVVFDDYQ